MITDVQQVKDLVLWAAKNHVKTLKVGDIQFELYDSALLSQLSNLEGIKTEPLSTSTTLTDTEKTTQAEEDDLLFWSSKG